MTFIPYEVPPEPIGGYAALVKHLVYPRVAASMGLEGTVIVRAFVDKSGKVTQTFIMEGFPATSLDEAAVAALKVARPNFSSVIMMGWVLSVVALGAGRLWSKSFPVFQRILHFVTETK